MFRFFSFSEIFESFSCPWIRERRLRILRNFHADVVNASLCHLPRQLGLLEGVLSYRPKSDLPLNSEKTVTETGSDWRICLPGKWSPGTGDDPAGSGCQAAS